MHTQTLDAVAREPAVPTVSWMPTRKWIAGMVTAMAAFLVNWINAGEFTKEIKIQLVGVMAAAVVAYLIPNDTKTTAT